MKQKSKNILWRLFKPKFKSHLIDEKYRVEEAFTFGGVKYFHFPDQFQVPAGRQMMALAYYEELAMRCDREYLEKHTAAVDKVLSDTKKISIKVLLQLNNNMQERLELLPLPDYIYRLGSVYFFDESESIYTYDYDYNQKKIEKWKKSGDVLDFFLRTPLKDLIPYLESVNQNSKTYFPVVEQVNRIHQERLSDILSEGQ